MTTQKDIDIVQSVAATSLDRFAQAYREWLGRLVTLSAGALTLLVSLQNSYVPKAPQGIWLLQCTWISLAVAILSGVLALFGEAQSHRDFLDALSRRFRDIRDNRTENDPIPAVQEIIQSIPYKRRPIFHASMCGCVMTFCLAVVSLAWFAVLNLK